MQAIRNMATRQTGVEATRYGRASSRERELPPMVSDEESETGYIRSFTVQDSKTRSLEVSATALTRLAFPIVICHVYVGLLVFSHLEQWTHRDALYYCITLLTTVGYGDLAPNTVGGKLFSCFYIIVSISVVSASVGAIFGNIYANMKTWVHASSFTARLVSAFASMAFVTIGGACFAHISEGWSAADSLYWAVVTCSSVGLGDLSISSVSRSWNAVYMLLAVGVFAVSAGSIATVFADIEVQRAVKAFLAGGVNADLIAEMDEDAGGSVSQYEFLTYMLVHTGKVTKGDIREIRDLFAELDRDGSGSLDKDDIHAAMAPAPGTPSKRKANQYHVDPMQCNSVTSKVRVLWPCLSDCMLSFVQWKQQMSRVKLVDAAIAGAGLSLSVLMLSCLDMAGSLPFQVFAPPMLASAIIFFGGSRPPPPSAFITCTVGSFVVGAVLNQVGMQASLIVQCFAAGSLLLFKKVSGSFFPPTVGLAAFLAQSGQGGHAHSIAKHLGYVIAPWGAGHFVLYIMALLLASVRQNIRVQISRQAWKQKLGKEAHGPGRETYLRKVFDRFDTSGDGQLDATELKLALRSITGTELETEDCERMIRSMDTDGNGSIDFHEFILALDEHI